MDVLLDSHIALWWAEEPERLTPEAQAELADPRNDVWVSAASSWELAIKVKAGKLTLDVRRLMSGLQERGIRLLGIGVDDGIEATGLDWGHRDPFDRMLVAQAARAGLTLVTRDRSILDYGGVTTLPG